MVHLPTLDELHRPHIGLDCALVSLKFLEFLKLYKFNTRNFNQSSVKIFSLNNDITIKLKDCDLGRVKLFNHSQKFKRNFF